MSLSASLEAQFYLTFALAALFASLITLAPLLMSVIITSQTLCVEKFEQVIKLVKVLFFQTKCFYSVHNENLPGKLKSSRLSRLFYRN